MENIAVSRIMRLVHPLSTDLKLEVLTKLSESIKKEFLILNNSREQLLEELSGTWSDLPDNLSDEILSNRTSSLKIGENQLSMNF